MILLVGPAAARHFIDAPGVGRLWTAGERAAQRNHEAHAIRHHLGELACVNATKAPADQADLAPVRVIEFMHQIQHRALHALAQAEIAALAPAANGIAVITQKAAQRTGRAVRCDKPGQHQHRVTIALRRQAEQRQCADKCAKLVDRPSFQKHQGSGRRAQRLGGSGHCLSSRSSNGLASDNAAQTPSFRSAAFQQLWR